MLQEKANKGGQLCVIHPQMESHILESISLKALFLVWLHKWYNSCCGLNLFKIHDLNREVLGNLPWKDPLIFKYTPNNR
jgi:hypothetical protein